jgi:hypothetical protein
MAHVAIVELLSDEVAVRRCCDGEDELAEDDEPCKAPALRITKTASGALRIGADPAAAGGGGGATADGGSGADNGGNGGGSAAPKAPKVDHKARLKTAPVEGCEPLGDPQLAPVYVSQMVPILIRSHELAIHEAVRRELLKTLSKMLRYATPAMLVEMMGQIVGSDDGKPAAVGSAGSAAAIGKATATDVATGAAAAKSSESGGGGGGGGGGAEGDATATKTADTDADADAASDDDDEAAALAAALAMSLDQPAAAVETFGSETLITPLAAIINVAELSKTHQHALTIIQYLMNKVPKLVLDNVIRVGIANRVTELAKKGKGEAVARQVRDEAATVAFKLAEAAAKEDAAKAMAEFEQIKAGRKPGPAEPPPPASPTPASASATGKAAATGAVDAVDAADAGGGSGGGGGGGAPQEAGRSMSKLERKRAKRAKQAARKAKKVGGRAELVSSPPADSGGAERSSGGGGAEAEKGGAEAGKGAAEAGASGGSGGGRAAKEGSGGGGGAADDGAAAEDGGAAAEDGGGGAAAEDVVVKVAGSRGAVYDVNVGKKTCTCPSFMHGGAICKHLRALDGSLAAKYAG